MALPKLLTALMICALVWLNYTWVYSTVNVDAVFEDKTLEPFKVSALPDLDRTMGLIQFNNTLSRPLFTESRKVVAIVKPKPSVPKKAKPAPKAKTVTNQRPPLIVILGILKNAKTQKVLIVDNNTGKSDWFAVGDLIGEWKVKTIEEDKIILFSNRKSLPVFLHPPGLKK